MRIGKRGACVHILRRCDQSLALRAACGSLLPGGQVKHPEQAQPGRMCRLARQNLPVSRLSRGVIARAMSGQCQCKLAQYVVREGSRHEVGHGGTFLCLPDPRPNS